MNYEEKSRQEILQKEYDVVANTWRYFASLRFIVAAFTATLQSALFTFYTQQQDQFRMAVTAFVGLYIMLAIGFVEWRNIVLFRTMVRRGKELEFSLGITQGHFQRLSEPQLVRPKGIRRLATHTWGITLIYLMISCLWLALLSIALFKEAREPIPVVYKIKILVDQQSKRHKQLP